MGITYGADREGGEFIGSKQIHPFTHIHTDAQLYMLVHYVCLLC